MKGVGDLRPGKAGCPGLRQQIRKTFQKQQIIILICKDFLAVNSPAYHMMQGSGCVDARLSWHVHFITFDSKHVN